MLKLLADIPARENEDFTRAVVLKHPEGCLNVFFFEDSLPEVWIENYRGTRLACKAFSRDVLNKLAFAAP